MAMNIPSRWLFPALVGAVLLTGATARTFAGGQNVLLGKEKDILFDNTRYARGQNVVPVFEGWVKNPDGTVTMVFGYFNRNWEEELMIPVGPANNITPGAPDREQPTYFLPRRQRNVVLVKMPKDYTKGDVIWTLTVNGKTEKAYGSLIPQEEITEQAVRTGGSINVDSDDSDNAAEAEVVYPPSIKIAPVESASIGSAVKLTAMVSDNPRPPKPQAGGNQRVMRVVWLEHRGPAKVTFSPRTVPISAPSGRGRVVNGTAVTSATFDAPGTYVLRGTVIDRAGISDTSDVTVTVR
jgi:hypothetical protein